MAFCNTILDMATPLILDLLSYNIKIQIHINNSENKNYAKIKN